MAKKSAIHTKQSFNDQHAIGMLSGFLASTHRVMPDLKSNDKWPNIDGIVEVTDKAGHPIGMLKVQVKKLTVKNAKSKKYYFSSKDDKFLDYCRESKDWVPILLIGVDVDKEKAYWLHIDHDYLEANKGSRTIRFIDTQVVEKKNEKYIDDWESILEIYNSKSQFFDKFKQAYSILADVVTPALGRTDKRYIPIHEYLDHTNYLLDYIFPIVKRVFYPATWKLGFALHEFSETELIYSLYPIATDRNDVQIKEIDSQLINLLQGQGLEFSMHSGSNPILENPEKLATKFVREKVFSVVEYELLNYRGNELLAKEYVFAFIDRYYIQLGLEKKNSYPVDEIEFGFYSYLPLWVDEAYKLLISRERNNLKERVIKDAGYYNIDIVGETINDELDEINAKVDSRLSNKSKPRNMILAVRRGLKIGLFRDFLSFLKQQKVSIDRPYKTKDYERGNGFLHRTLSNDDAEFNLQQIFSNYQSAYETVVANNFPRMHDELSIFKDFDKLLYHFEFLDEDSVRSGSVYDLYNLVSNTKNIEKEIRIIDDATSEKLKGGFVTRALEFEGNTYDSYYGQGSLDFLYEDTPLLNLINMTASDNLRRYFDKNDNLYNN